MKSNSEDDSKPYKLTGMLADYFWSKWLLGCVASVVFFVFGCKEIMTQQGTLYLPYSSSTLNAYTIKLVGLNAVLLGISHLMLALSAHFWLFWRHTDCLERYHQPLGYLSTVGWLVSVVVLYGYVLVHTVLF